MSSSGDARVEDAELYEVLAALGDLLFPIEEDGISLEDAGVLAYVERILAGRCARDRPVYEAGVRWLNDYARENGAPGFAQLPRDAQEDVVRRLMDEASRVDVPLGLSGSPVASALALVPGEIGFVMTYWQHLREGLFCDPRHGGNRDAVVWKWLGYNGPQMHGYTDAEVLGTEPLRRPIRTADDWEGVDDA